jgi:phosphomannomutase
MKISCVKAYDIRGELETQLNEDVAYRIGRAYGDLYQPKTVAVGCDIRLSSESLKQATIKGLNDAGVNVLDLGMTGTEEVYFAAFHLDVQGGIEITASHNPMNYNGMKLVKENARPISIDTGLREIQAIAESGGLNAAIQYPARICRSFDDIYRCCSLATIKTFSQCGEWRSRSCD